MSLFVDWGWHGALCAAIIVGIFAVSCKFVLGPLKRARGAIIEANRNLLNGRSDQPFPNEANELREAWNRYRIHYRNEQANSGGFIVHTIDPADYLTDAIILRDYNHKLAVTLAGVFTALGILATFVGLSIGMPDVDSSSSSIDIKGIMDMLKGMKVAFYNSMIGTCQRF